MRLSEKDKLARVRAGGFFERGDALLFALLFVAVALFTALAFAFRGETGGRAEIRVNGSVVHVMDTDKYERYAVETESGYNVVISGGGAVYVKDADCGDGTCMRYGKITRVGETIVCLPHGLTVEIVAGKGGGSDV